MMIHQIIVATICYLFSFLYVYFELHLDALYDSTEKRTEKYFK